MHTTGIIVSVLAFLLDGLLVWRGSRNGLLRSFPLFYSYLVYAFCGSLCLYFIYWFAPQKYPSAYWIYFLVTILAEFMVLVEVSDQIFRPYPAIRHLGRAMTILISVGFGLFYILPAVVWSNYIDTAMFSFALRASITKVVILAGLFYLSHRFGSRLGKNVGGLMLGFSIYVAVGVALMANASAFGPSLYAQVFWVMVPLSFLLCLLVWTLSLWELVPAPVMRSPGVAARGESTHLTLELTRFNDELSRFLRK